MEVQSEVSHMEHSIEAAKQLVAERDLALKLYANPDFKKLILENFCVRDCARFVQQSAEFGIPKENREDALAMAQAAGHLRRWLSQCVQMGNTYADKIDEMEAQLVEARQEEEGGE
jgi:hypothetical protein